MLPPVSAASTISLIAAPRDVPVVTQALTALVATPDAAVALSLAANSEVEGKLNMLLIAARERMIDSLFAVVDAVSQSLAMQPDAGESNVGYALRLAQTINDLTPTQAAAVQQQLNAQGQTSPLALVARALQNPAGTEAAQVVAYMEVVRYKEKDLATKAVVASYGQNGAEEQGAAPAPRTVQQTLSGNAGAGAAATPSGLPAVSLTAPQTVAIVPPAPGAQVSTANTDGAPASAPLVATPSAQATVTAPGSPAGAAASLSTTSAAVTTPEAAVANATNLAQPTIPALSPPGTSPQVVPPFAAGPGTVKDAPPATPSAQPTAAAAITPIDVAKSAPAPQGAPASQAAAILPRIITNAQPPSSLANAPLAGPQLQPVSTSQQAPFAPLVSSAAAGLLPAIEAFAENITQPQTQPPFAANQGAAAPPPRPQAAPVTTPTPSASGVQTLLDAQEGLKVAVDRLLSATGAELLQTLAEVAPVAEKVVAQALVADMLDSAELGTLPSPDDTTAPARVANASAAATIDAGPVEELSSLIALNQILKEAAPMAQAAVLQQPLPVQFPVGVPFAVAQYLPADDVAEDNESLHVDRVDAVDDEENEETGGRRRGSADEEEAERQAEADDAVLAASEGLEPDETLPATVDLKISRPLALPRPAPIEPAFNLYQRMGGWD